MPQPRLTLKSVRARPVVVPLKRPIVSKVGLFQDVILIDLATNEGIVGQSYLEPAKPFEVQDGQRIVPDRPGSGIEWNEEAVKKYAR